MAVRNCSAACAPCRPPLDLAACSRRMEKRDNRVYQRRCVRRMRQRLCATGRYRERDFAGLHTVMAIDDHITAPSFGFGDAENYCRTQSAMRYLDGLRVPMLLIYSKDDTLVPCETSDAAAVAQSLDRASAGRTWRTFGIPGTTAASVLAGWTDSGGGWRGPFSDLR